MNDSLIADIWTVMLEKIPEKHRTNAAAEYVNVLLDHGIKDFVLSDLLGVDPYLDVAIRYAIDDDDQDFFDEYEQDDA